VLSNARREEEGGCRNLLQVHPGHGLVHLLHNSVHGLGNGFHGDSGLHLGGHGVQPRGKAQVVQTLVLLPDRILGVDLGTLKISLLNGLSTMITFIHFIKRFISHKDPRKIFVSDPMEPSVKEEEKAVSHRALK